MKRLTFATLLGLFLLPAVSADAAPEPVGDAVTVEDGRKIWMNKKNKCAKCHGPDGKGQTKMGKKKKVPDMSDPAWQKRFSDKQIMEAVLKGIDRKDGDRKVKMKPLKGATERDAKAILKLVRSFKRK